MEKLNLHFSLRKVILPICDYYFVKSSKMYATNDLQNFSVTESDLKDGLYLLVGKDLVRQEESESLSYEDYPILEDFEELETQFNIPAEVKNLLSYVNTDDIRHNMTGISFREIDGKLYMEATDGFRAMQKEIAFESRDIKGLEIIVPTAAIKQILKGKPYLIKARLLKDGAIKLSTEDVTIYSKLIDDKFPQITSVLPDYADEMITVRRNELLRAIEDVKAYANKHTKRIGIYKSENGLKILAENITEEFRKEVEIVEKGLRKEVEVYCSITDLQNGAEEKNLLPVKVERILMPIRSEVEEEYFAVQYSYLIDVLKSMESNTVYIGFQTKSRAIIFSEVDLRGETETVLVGSVIGKFKALKQTSLFGN